MYYLGYDFDVSLEVFSKNMEVVCKVKEVYNCICVWGGIVTEVYLFFFDIEWIGWEEGDVICGLIVVGDGIVVMGMMWVICDVEFDD